MIRCQLVASQQLLHSIAKAFAETSPIVWNLTILQHAALHASLNIPRQTLDISLIALRQIAEAQHTGGPRKVLLYAL